MIWQIVALLMLGSFYAVYFGKMFAQKRKGIQTDQIARGKSRHGKRYRIELIMKIATYSVVAVELFTIFLSSSFLPWQFRAFGALFAFAGVMIFSIAVFTMRDSWRAGIAEQEQTDMITDGIYSISRNPAFLGFDLLYLGILLIFFHWVLLVVSVFAAFMLHLQTLQEERYLTETFGAQYSLYMQRVGRYIGRKRKALNH